MFGDVRLTATSEHGKADNLTAVKLLADTLNEKQLLRF